ncbi:MAG: FAD-dependent oxidoreductase [Deltaproteobacteria bacterium]|jgi:thioredoxin reductase (NADPH)|nr:FAD-dependent oxidoreductase [Deltaproteobacteria bacterium]
MKTYDLVIVGGGPAGLSASIYAARAGLKVLVLEQTISGGQMRLTGTIENYPGFPEVTGAELSEALHRQAQKQGAELAASVARTLKAEDGRFVIESSTGTYLCGAVVAASGTFHRNLPCPGAEEFVGRGVSFCALCDAGFVRDETVAAVGGGNSALEEADFLTKYASKVYVIHRRDEFRADRALQDRVRANPKIELVLSAEIDAIEGSDIVERVLVRDKKTGEVKELSVGGIFMFVGSSPNADYLPRDVKRAEGGWIATDQNLQTSLPGLFAAGDVRDTDMRQIVTATADGARAGMNAHKYLEETRWEERLGTYRASHGKS